MLLDDKQAAFIKKNSSAAMITVGSDGVAKTARISVGLFEGKLVSSGTSGRVRSTRLRRDPRCTLFLFDPTFAFLNLETTVTMIEGEDGATGNLRLMRAMQHTTEGPISWFGQDYDEDAFLQLMRDDGRLVYEFEVTKAYGLY